jgi:hypothetical protein
MICFIAKWRDLPDVLKIIKDYTRPDWRTLHLMPLQNYIYEYYLQYSINGILNILLVFQKLIGILIINRL